MNVSNEYQDDNGDFSAKYLTDEIYLLEEYLNQAIIIMTLIHTKESVDFIYLFDKDYKQKKNIRKYLMDVYQIFDHNLKSQIDKFEYGLFGNKRLIEIYEEVTNESIIYEIIQRVNNIEKRKNKFAEIIICDDYLLIKSIQELILSEINTDYKIIELIQDDQLPKYVDMLNIYLVNEPSILNFLLSKLEKKFTEESDSFSLIFYMNKSESELNDLNKINVLILKSYQELEKYFAVFLSYFILSSNKTINEGNDKLIQMINELKEEGSFFTDFSVLNNFSQLSEYSIILNFEENKITNKRELLTYLIAELNRNKYIYIKENYFWKNGREYIILFRGTKYRTKATAKGILLDFILNIEKQQFIKASEFLRLLSKYYTTSYDGTFETVEDNFDNLIKELKGFENKWTITRNKFSEYLINNVHFDNTKNAGVQIKINNGDWQFKNPHEY